ncbi:ABC transporter ATP-binding protein [Cytobacillus horneckiae]|uniref:Multidrug ABC transporter ATP-binding protein n=1 Tax=Cytobacillus horneckiae TaxID=549687 RepID=A0A2N0Z8R2_9BACI|nr:ABC transporter ATP-binding protein [Cytobacillus horneckiae]MBN6889423.1 ABC transporter ATP-binding protein [Cytobacillus horneckiae]MCM3176889.1 ABC transporter ATP-binding protein/permease [Cytobacillus horneckiae]MEC1156733.1 ABC transporter ATP-binding protein [Cytobacillus horneckiae]MED2939046.1 ABC transporter ATP-binding protein [Cytobacillus horneckiae]PKG25894.1 multidrug ABC transporter ATP-binding protein [Cytobacillus horneckiae]
MKRQKGGMVLAILLVMISTALSLLGPYLIGRIMDDYIIPRDINGTMRLAGVLAAVYAGAAIITWLQSYVMVRVSLKTIQQMRQDLFNHFQRLSLSFFDKRKHGELMSRVTNDIENLNAALSQSVVQIFSSVLTIAGVAIAMLMLNWMLAIVTLFVIPFMFYATNKIIKYSSSNFIKRQRDLGAMNGTVEESISGLEIITLYGKEEAVYERFSAENERLRSSAMMAEISSGFLGPVNNFINNLGLALVIFAGAVLTINEMATIGIIAAFVTYARSFYRPINQMSNLINTFQSAIAGAERVFEIMDEKPDMEDHPHAIEVAAFTGTVNFSHVSFAYEDKLVLSDIHFSVKPGETVALVGATGSGKTTIINLLARFYDVTAGEVQIDGRRVQDYSIQSLRSKVGIVLQETYLFSGTVMDNIRYGRLDATDDEVVEAAKLASADGFIKHLPEKYNTKIDSGGVNLSQGQKQLIAIARAMLAESDILILDEATSSIDTRTEIEIQKGLAKLTEGKTTFIIAHRLKTIEQADTILVIKDGSIIEKGNHRQLLQQHGIYHDMYNQQFTI